MKFKEFVFETMIKPLPKWIMESILMYWASAIFAGIIAGIITFFMRRKHKKIQ